MLPVKLSNKLGMICVKSPVLKASLNDEAKVFLKLSAASTPVFCAIVRSGVSTGGVVVGAKELLEAPPVSAPALLFWATSSAMSAARSAMLVFKAS